MRYSIVKYRRMTCSFFKVEFSSNLDLFFISQGNFDFLFGFFSSISLTKFGVSGSLSSVSNFCFITGRVRGLIRVYCLSRIVFRMLVGEGVLVGMRSAMW